MIYLVEYKGLMGWYQRIMRAENLVELLRQLKFDKSQYEIKACLGKITLNQGAKNV